KFVANPFVPGQRMYRAGDVARRRIDGELEYIGRTDDQVKIRGYRIELGEVEGAIRALTGVREVVVIARSAESGWQELCAYVVTDGNMTGRELRAALSASLPEYMIPTYFVPLEALPLTSNGKMDRKALPAPQAYVEPGVAYAPPRNAVEEHLVSIWAAVLGVAQVGIYDSFLDLGGDSIKSIQVSAKLFQAGYQVGMKELLTNPTIAALSSHVEPVKRTAEQGEIRGVTGMTPIQQAFVIEQATDLHHYNQCVVLQRPDGWEVRALQAAMQAITDHHDALRTVLRRSDSGYTAWTRQIGEGAGYSLEVLDMAPDTDSEEAIAAEASRIQATMDLSEGPLVKLGLFRCTDGDHLLVAIHHWVIDGVSWRILLEDLGTAYTQAQQGEPIRLPMKTDAFQAWAEGLSHYARSEALQAEAGYWAGIQATAAPQLPQDYAETGVSLVKDSEEVTVQWTAGETEQLLKQSHRAYTTEMNDL
ncbi:aryl carrier-like protein, partial [Paenibacillus sp. RC21]